MELVIPKGGGQIARRKAISAIEALPVEQAYEIKIAEYRRKRSTPQNAYYWGVVLPMLSEFTGSTVDELHRIMLCEVMGEEIVEAGPWKIRRPRRTTTTGYEGERDVLTTVQFMAYIDRVRQVAADIGCNVPDPSSDYWQHEAE